jgi:hypothetical protein
MLLTRILWRARIQERLPVGPRQGAVVICNDRSSVAPLKPSGNDEHHCEVGKFSICDRKPAYSWPPCCE